MSPREALGDWADEIGLALEASAWVALEALVQLWQRYGKAFNLVGDLSADALHAHIREGLMAVRVAELADAGDGPWLDIGSGGGVPGLVVAAVRPGVVLVEPRERRAAFLRLAVGTLKYTETTVVRARVVDTTWETMPLAEPYNHEDVDFRVVASKAVMSLDCWLPQGKLLAPQGVIVGHATRSAVDALGLEGQIELVWGDRVVLGVAAADFSGENPPQR